MAALLAVSCSAPAAVTPASTAAVTPAASATEATHSKPSGIDTSQRQLPLVTSVRWAVDRSATEVRLILYHEGMASSFQIIDQVGATVLRVEIAGSGIFDDTSCVTHHLPAELVTWRGIDPAQLAVFEQQYRSYRVVATGIPTGEATLPLTDSGCRGTIAAPRDIAPRLPVGYDLPPDCRYYDVATTTGAATAWKIFCPQGLPSNYLRPSLAAQGWISCDTKVWKRADVQLALTDTVNTPDYNALLDQRPLANGGCVAPTP